MRPCEAGGNGAQREVAGDPPESVLAWARAQRKYQEVLRELGSDLTPIMYSSFVNHLDDMNESLPLTASNTASIEALRLELSRRGRLVRAELLDEINSSSSSSSHKQ